MKKEHNKLHIIVWQLIFITNSYMMDTNKHMCTIKDYKMTEGIQSLQE